MQSTELRRAFLEFFEERDHLVLPSASLIPPAGSLLFTIAGMVPFDKAFLGEVPPPAKNVATIQKCMRVSGKQNDLEEVGISPIHHTFLEMLGNFSFSGYFKRETIRYAWDLLTGPLGLDPDRMSVSVYETDVESEEIWQSEIGLTPDRIVRLGKDSNFWSMGGAGPCGPNTEIFYDRGPEFGPSTEEPARDGSYERYPELWNLVFMQYEQNDEGEIIADLVQPGVDTGSGFERVLSVLQGVASNYDTDVFAPVITKAEELTGARHDGPQPQRRLVRILADHARALTFLIADGVVPGNEGRGYVLRRILRRALTKARQASVNTSLLGGLCGSVIDKYSDVYPNLATHASSILEIVTNEEQRFGRTLDAGLSLLEEEMKTAGKTLSGELVFKLHDTYGFPVEVTEDLASENGVSIDAEGFKALMDEQRDRSRTVHKTRTSAGASAHVTGTKTEFVGYGYLDTEARLTELTKISEDTFDVVLDRTSFYSEGGGQVGDRGTLQGDDFEAQVIDTQRSAHRVRLIAGELHKDADVVARVDPVHRASVQRAHTATHMLHHALRDALGGHVRQMGSLVEPGRLRFDFSHFVPAGESIREIEEMINSGVVDDDNVRWFETSYNDAVDNLGAMHFFEDKYENVVRVVEIGDYSRELCAGTHVNQTGQIGIIKLISEGSIGANLRRVEALTGMEGLAWINRRLDQAQAAAELAKVAPDDLLEGIERLVATAKELEKSLEQQRGQHTSQAAGALAAEVREVDGGRLLVARRDVDVATLRALGIDLRDRIGGVVILASAMNGKVSLIGGVSKSLPIDAREILKDAAALIGGRVGGRPELAQGGGSNPDAIDKALTSARLAAEQALKR